MIFTPLLFTFAFGTSSPLNGDIGAIDGQPTISILLDRSDLATKDVRKIEGRIKHAATSVCDRAYRRFGYRETVACVKDAIADGQAQLESLRLDASRARAELSITVPATEH